MDEIGAPSPRGYSPDLVRHARDARNRRVIPDASHRAPADNPLCGDRLDVYLMIEDGVIRDIAYEGCACAVATASASMMSQALQGAHLAHAQALHASFCRFVGPQGEWEPGMPEEMRAFENIRALPGRMQCAELAWLALRAALFQDNRRAAR
jgi:nitrogen fixation NifU-like protein